MKSLIIVLCVLISVVNCAKEFPSDIPRCHAGDTKCIENAVTEVFRKFPGGHQGLYLPQIDPLHVDTMNIIEETGERPVNIKLYFKNIDFIGLKNARASKIVGFERDAANSKFELGFIVPRFEMIADYEIDGRVLVLPITGKGKSNITLENVKVIAKFQAVVIEKNGKQYAQIGDSKYKLVFEAEDISLNLENLFNGDKALGETMNRFLNENSRELYNELAPSFADAFKGIVKVYVNRILTKISYDDFWLE